MKDSKFIELLNLYVDHQINAADAAQLEAEIQSNPKRRQVYRQYCQMQKACVVLAETFRTDARDAAIAGEKIVQFAPGRRRLASVAYALGAMAAAAAVAFVIVQRDHGNSLKSSQTQVAAQTASAAPALAIAAPAAAQAVATARSNNSAVVPTRVALQPAFAGLVRDNAAVDAAVAASDRAPFDWMSRVQLQRVPAEELWFQARPAMQTEDLLLRSRNTFRGQVENAAFRFQR